MAGINGKLVVDRVADGRIDATYLGEGTPTFELRLGAQRLGSAVPQAQPPRRVSFEIPATVISDGVHALEIVEAGQSEVLASVALIAGAPYGDDLHAQVALLRAEVDQLKALLRRRLP